MADYRRNLSKSVCEGLLQGDNKRYTCKVVPSISETLVDQYDGDIHVRYHDTDVVVFGVDTITLSSGGFKTVTTKARINACLSGTGWRLCQTKKEWFVERDGLIIPFHDGMTISA